MPHIKEIRYLSGHRRDTEMWEQVKVHYAIYIAPLIAGLTWVLTPETHCGLPPIRDLSIEPLQEFLSNSSLTFEILVWAYLARIADVNPSMHSVIEIDQNAIQDARDLDQERRSTGKKIELHGIPILVKDSMSTDGMNNSVSSYCLLSSTIKKEASVITRLRAAGAIIPGKTSMSQ